MPTYQDLSVTGSQVAYRRACIACTQSKRKCTKQVPACQRCATKGLECLYPPVRQTNVWLGSVAESISPTESVEEGSSISIDLAVLRGSPSASDTQGSSLSVTHNPGQRVTTPIPFWFAAQHSWDIYHTLPGHTTEWFDEKTLKSYVATIQGWLKRWISEDHCPLIHRQLYQMHMPRCIQDAYTALVAYFNRTPSTESTVFRIIEDRVNQLIQEYAQQPPLDLASLTVADHAARVQALFIFQTIRLFDGDIRMRARAETQIPTLISWNEQMWQRIREEMSTADPKSTMPFGLGPYWGSWKMWIFVESVRRTWLTTSTLHCVYMTIKEGYSLCPGGIYCTFGNELWDIASAHEWETRTSQGKAHFLQSLNIGDLFVDSNPSHVDEFGHATLLITFGLDRIDRWMRETAEEGLGLLT